MDDIMSLEAQVQTAQNIREHIVMENLVKRPGQWRVDEEGTIWVKD